MGAILLVACLLLSPTQSVVGNGALASRTMGSPAPLPLNNTAPQPCDVISRRLSRPLHRGPAASAKLPAELAAACLRSVPNHQQPAVKLIQSLRAYVQWHSSLAWLRRPPPAYPFPPVDVDAGLARLGAQVEAHQFASEYDFQVQLGRLLASARDPHLVFEGDVFKPFLFRNDLLSDIVSVSIDGVELPKLHHKSRRCTNTTKPWPAILRINGLDATVLVEQLGNERTSLPDPDGMWNSHFPTYAAPDRSLPLSLSSEFLSKGISIEYEDGSTSFQPSYAVLRPHVNFTGVCGGEAFYRRFCSPGLEASTLWAGPPRSSRGPPSGGTLAGDASIAGSFLNTTRYNDVAVLDIMNFGTDEGVGAASRSGRAAEHPGLVRYVRLTVADFLEASENNRMKKLVIDLTGSAGTSLPAAIAILELLFPDVKVSQIENAGLHDGLVSLGRAAYKVLGNNVTSSAATTVSSVRLLSNRVAQAILPGRVTTPGGREFAAVSEILRPVHLHGGTFTAYQQRVRADLPGPPAPPARPGPGLFRPEDIVVLVDGTCHSACAFFYETTRRLNVTALAMWSCEDIRDAASSALRILQSRDETSLHLNLDIVSEGYAVTRSRDRALSCSVSGKNMFGPADAETPLQFSQQPADCRILYTMETVGDAKAMWRHVADVAWTSEGQRFCVARPRPQAHVA